MVSVVSQWCCSGVMVLSQWWCCNVSSGVPVVSRWLVPRSCPGGVAAASRGVPALSSGVRWLVSQWCLEGFPVLFQSGVLVVSRASWVLVVFHPVVSRSCPVFHAVVSRSRPPFRKICDCGAVGVLLVRWLVRWLVGLRWGGAGR